MVVVVVVLFHGVIWNGKVPDVHIFSPVACCKSFSVSSTRYGGNAHTHTHPFNGPLSRTTQVSRYQKGKTNRDFTEARDSEWQWHQQGHMQVCTSLQTDNHASTTLLSFLQAGCPSCRPTNSVKTLKATVYLKFVMSRNQRIQY